VTRRCYVLPVCCFVIVLGLLGPRVAFLVTWLATNRVAVAFHNGFVVPFLGLLFLPWTVLLYTLAYAPVGGVSGAGWFLVALGVLADVAGYISGPAQRRRAAIA
jgi:hypothetical protein